MGVKREACDVHFSKAVRHRDKNICQYCGGHGTDAAHIYGRAKKSVRWSMDNALCLCRHHHRHLGANPIEFFDFLTRLYGPGHMDLLREKANAVLKTNKSLRLDISKHYRTQLKLAESDPTHLIESWN